MKELVVITNQPFIPGAEVDVLSECPQFREADASQVVVDDPWWGIAPLTVAPYNAATYPTFANWGEIMFNASARKFRTGAFVWAGKITAYVIPRGSRVLVS